MSERAHRWVTPIVLLPMVCSPAAREFVRSPASTPHNIPAASAASRQGPLPTGCDEAAFAKLTRLEQLSMWCCDAALRDAGWWERRGDVRVGLVLGIGAEWLVLWEADALAGGNGIFHPERDGWDRWSEHLSSLAAVRAGGERVGGLRQRQLRPGPGAALAGAGLGRRLPGRRLRHGRDADVAGRLRQPAGPVAPQRRPASGLAALRPRPRRLRHGRRRGGVRPGAAPTARSRAARVYAEVAGCGASSDAHHMVIPSPRSRAGHRRHAPGPGRRPASIPTEVDYVNAHATSTPVGDIAEATRAGNGLRRRHCRDVPVSSTKSMTGHLLTAAAAVEALACIVAMERRAIAADDQPRRSRSRMPPCATCPTRPRTTPVRVAVSNSFGFGGSNTCLVLKAA